MPAILRPFILAQCEGKTPLRPLFPAKRKSATGFHWRDWPRENVQRICQLAGVPEVCAHAMRGLHGTLRTLSGEDIDRIAGDLGHEDRSTTLTSYVDRAAAEFAGQQRALRVLDGGKAA